MMVDFEGTMDRLNNLRIRRENKKEKGTNMTTIKIKGMSCQHCVMAVTKALAGIAGTKDVRVDLQKGEASFTEEKPVDRVLIRERIAKAGFEVVD
jgi:copper chaperone